MNGIVILRPNKLSDSLQSLSLGCLVAAVLVLDHLVEYSIDNAEGLRVNVGDADNTCPRRPG
jgi:hypothetical protein